MPAASQHGAPGGLRLATRTGYSSRVYSKSVGMFSKVQSFKIIRPLSNCMSYKACPRGELRSPLRNPLNFPACSPRMPRPTQPCASPQCNTVSHGAPTSDSSRANPFVGQYPGGSRLENVFGHVRNSDIRKRALDKGLKVPPEPFRQLPARVPSRMLRPTKPCGGPPLQNCAWRRAHDDLGEALEQGFCKFWDVF